MVTITPFLRVRLRSGIVALVAGALLLGLADAGEPQLKGGAMLDCSGLPCVEATTASGAQIKMLVDTGDFRATLDEAVARTLGLEIKPFIGRDGKPHPEYSIGLLKDLRIGEGHLGDVSVLVTNLKPEIEKGAMPDAGGSLTYDTFAGRLLRMDYKHRRVELSAVLTQAAPCPHDCAVLSTPTFGAKGPPIVVSNGFQVNGWPVVAQIDTLYAGTMLIYPTAIDKLGLTRMQSSKKMRSFAYTDGGVQMIEGMAAAEGFGGQTLANHCPIYFATPEVHAPDGMFDGTVGNELFIGHVLSFDFYAHHFWIT